MAPERCHFCKNAVLEFQPTAVEHGHKYHVKCLASAQGTPRPAPLHPNRSLLTTSGHFHLPGS